MGGWVSLTINILAIVGFYRIGQTPLTIVSIINGIIGFWSFGVMHNYASYAMRDKADLIEENLKAEDNFSEEANERLEAMRRTTDPNATPDWLAKINLASFVFSIVLIVTFFVIKA